MQTRLRWGAALLLVLSCLPVLAEEPMTLEDIVVSEKKLVKPTKQTNETVYTGSEIKRAGITLNFSGMLKRFPRNIQVMISAMVRSMRKSLFTQLIKRQDTIPRIAENPGEYPVSMRMVRRTRGSM